MEHVAPGAISKQNTVPNKDPALAALELRSIVKRFPGVLANDHIDLLVEKGEIRAILGENGAGKTTLMRVLYGLEQPDEGEIHLDGQRRVLRTPLDAIRGGLGMVHQHFMLFPSLTVGENVVFGQEPTRRGCIDRRRTISRVRDLAQRYGLEVDPEARLETLAVGVRQRVEILKALYRQAEILILDEPTTVLTPRERDGLFVVLRRLAAEGKAILFITHKLREVMDLTDRATVLRRGRVMETLKIADTSPDELGRLMVGREVHARVEYGSVVTESPVLKVAGLVVRDETGRQLVGPIDVSVHGGEIVGIAGVAGNGQSELIAALAGLRPVAEGRVMLADQDLTTVSVAERRRQGLAYVPEDRNGVGLALDATLEDNLLLASQARPDLNRRGVLAWRNVRSRAEGLIARFQIKGTPSTLARALSGGHRQRLVAARELAHDSRLVLVEQPTQGVDIGAAEFLLGRLADVRASGKAVLWVSSELAELLRLADRILVMFEGRVVAQVAAGEADEERLGLLMSGQLEVTAEEETG